MEKYPSEEISEICRDNLIYAAKEIISFGPHPERNPRYSELTKKMYNSYIQLGTETCLPDYPNLAKLNYVNKKTYDKYIDLTKITKTIAYHSHSIWNKPIYSPLITPSSKINVTEVHGLQVESSCPKETLYLVQLKSDDMSAGFGFGFQMFFPGFQPNVPIIYEIETTVLPNSFFLVKIIKQSDRSKINQYVYHFIDEYYN